MGVIAPVFDGVQELSNDQQGGVAGVVVDIFEPSSSSSLRNIPKWMGSIWGMRMVYSSFISLVNRRRPVSSYTNFAIEMFLSCGA